MTEDKKNDGDNMSTECHLTESESVCVYICTLSLIGVSSGFQDVCVGVCVSYQQLQGVHMFKVKRHTGPSRGTLVSKGNWMMAAQRYWTGFSANGDKRPILA